MSGFRFLGACTFAFLNQSLKIQKHSNKQCYLWPELILCEFPQKRTVSGALQIQMYVSQAPADGLQKLAAF